MHTPVLVAHIDQILEFLSVDQEAHGCFPTYRAFPGEVPSYVKPTRFAGWYDFGECPFSTANVAYHLARLDLPGTGMLRARACQSLLRGMENGVARYVPAHAKPIDFPTDVDDTCLAAAALMRAGYRDVCNVPMVLDNITRQGDIYTWLIPRRQHLKHPRNYLWLARDQRKIRTAMRSYGTPADRLAAMEREHRESFEPAVAANVLLYLGVTRQTGALLDTVIERILAGEVPLGYYSSPVAAYFHVARLHDAGVTQLLVTRDRILDDLAARQDREGSIDGPFFTALAALTAMYFNAWDVPFLRPAVHYLGSHPMLEGGWTPWHYCNDLDGVFVDGGAGLTATFFLEVFIRWQRRGI